MRYDIIFYISKRTSYCEKKIKKAFSMIDMQTNRILSCTSPVKLGELTVESLNLNNLVILVGGFNSKDDNNIKVILSRVLSSSPLSLKNAKKITSGQKEAYIITCKKQMILALPDDQDEIETILSESFLEQVREKLS